MRAIILKLNATPGFSKNVVGAGPLIVNHLYPFIWLIYNEPERHSIREIKVKSVLEYFESFTCLYFPYMRDFKGLLSILDIEFMGLKNQTSVSEGEFATHSFASC